MTAYQALEAIVADQLHHTIEVALFSSLPPPGAAGGVSAFLRYMSSKSRHFLTNSSLLLDSETHKQTHQNLFDSVDNIKGLALDAVQSAVAAQCHRVNAVAPVNALHDDNLVAIFAMLSSDSLFSASQTCAYWRALTLSAPTLWCSINLQPDPLDTQHSLEPLLPFRLCRRVDIMLERSQNLHLNVHFDLCNSLDGLREDEWDDEDRVAEAKSYAQRDLDLITNFLTEDVCRRLRSLAISYEHPIDPDNSHLFLPQCPGLVNLNLFWNDEPLQLLDIQISGGTSFGALKTLRLGGISNALKCLPALSNVVSFTFEFPDGDQDSDDDDEFFTLDISLVLKAFPQLARLRLDGLWEYDQRLVFTTAFNVPENPQNSSLRTLILSGRSGMAKLRSLESSSPLHMGAFHYIAADSCKIAAEIDIRFLLDHLRPTTRAATATAGSTELFAKADWKEIQNAFEVHLYERNENGKARSIISHDLTPGRLPLSTENYHALTLNLPFFAAAGFPVLLPNLTQLRMRIDHLYPTNDIHHRVSVPALREVQLYVLSQAISEPFETRSILRLFKRCFKNLVLPLQSLDIIGAKITDGDSPAAGQTSSLARRFAHGRRFE